MGETIAVEDTAGIVRIQGDKLDVSYINSWVEQLDLRDEWLRAKALAGQLSVTADEAPPQR